jgi:hypothetical protein
MSDRPGTVRDMAPDRLNARAVNPATLARQLLLARATAPFCPQWSN